MAALTPVVWMVGASGVLWAVIAAAGGVRVMPEAAYGLVAPLVSAVVSWLVTARVQATAPSRVTATMVGAFGVKAVFFAAYVVGVVRGLGLRPAPFAACFAGFFIALYAVEAFFLRRLFTEAAQAAARG